MSDDLIQGIAAGMVIMTTIYEVILPAIARNLMSRERQ